MSQCQQKDNMTMYTLIFTLKNVLNTRTFTQAVVSVTMYTLMLSQKNALSIHAFTQAVASNLCLDHGQVLVDTVFTEGRQNRSRLHALSLTPGT